MKASPAHRAVAELERRAAARLAAADAKLARLNRDKQSLVACHVQARQSMLASSQWRSLECQALAAHMLWVAAAAARISATQRHETVNRESIACERVHWARCRVGLERRARRADPQAWPD